jgi:hypothetical protein
MIGPVSDRDDVALAFGPVGLAGFGLLALGILVRSRLLAVLGLAGVAADVTVAELGGFKALNEGRADPSGDGDVSPPE